MGGVRTKCLECIEHEEDQKALFSRPYWYISRYEQFDMPSQWIDPPFGKCRNDGLVEVSTAQARLLEAISVVQTCLTFARKVTQSMMLELCILVVTVV